MYLSYHLRNSGFTSDHNDPCKTFNSTHQVLFAIGWTIHEISRLKMDENYLSSAKIMEQNVTLSLRGDIVGIKVYWCYSLEGYCCNPFDGVYDQSRVS